MPAKAKQEKRYGLGSKGSRDGGVDLTVPSGSLCRVIRPGPMGLIKLGLLDSLDSLTGLVQMEHFDRVDEKPTRVQADIIKEFAANTEAVKAGFALIDKVVVGCVLQPKIHPIPLDDNGEPLPREEWDEELIYIDSVDLEDKTFIMQFVVGGTADLEQFRAERDQLMDNVPNVQNVPLSAE